ncbi:MAG: bifunctional diaminohydroxyphosphoribosylaminopyrimidine deaminase/5-amino-6-(5-phosphoribosylamino)uracil reductase RibD [Elusimicrobia bacterium]|nr:bifunctional diaminohydroxyphosphoribosylaminopyrimidine deaminase/5-amino-6-(5-phosphoribosylamino)uracil reductase RibD [Elusimicrobiota bacterium]
MDKLKLMRTAISLALRGEGRVSPNPMVGAVIYKNGKIVSRGWHHFFGAPHAEIDAIKKAKAPLNGSFMFVNLEPCCHWGKTPPCAPQIAAAGIKKVFVASRDPNPFVNGRGINYLRRKGVSVEVGIASDEARFINRGYFSVFERKKPWVILKEGVSLDGKIATKTGDSKWITGKTARIFAHYLRYVSDIIVVGGRTNRIDKPRLTPYLWMGKTHPLGYPARCVVTKKMPKPGCLENVDNSNRLIFAVSGKRPVKSGIKNSANFEIIRFSNLNNLLGQLARKGYNKVLLEGGGELAGSFFDEGLVDEIFFIYAPVVIGGKKAVSAVSGAGISVLKKAASFKNGSISRIEDNFVFHGLRDVHGNY